LQPDVGNIALLQRAEAAGLLSAGVGVAAANAYRDLRRAQNLARLDERAPRVPLQELASQRAAVLELWRSVFG
jgi:glutamate-ammonia-ligase adenylyltransferase